MNKLLIIYSVLLSVLFSMLLWDDLSAHETIKYFVHGKQYWQNQYEKLERKCEKHQLNLLY